MSEILCKSICKILCKSITKIFYVEYHLPLTLHYFSHLQRGEVLFSPQASSSLRSKFHNFFLKVLITLSLICLVLTP